MGEPLSVLLIEDSEDDAMLIVRELKHGGYDVDYERLDTTDAVKDALRRRKWDVILSDHAMPQICAPSALTIVKEAGLDTPFIIVSGWMTPELAEEVKKEGARDFVPKNRLARLVPIVERELKAKKAKKGPGSREETANRKKG
jgi:DNA-binding NtrC family response regulator